MTEHVDVTVTPETSAAPAPVVTLAPKDFAWGTGRRKTSVARVRIKAGSGAILVNGRPFEDYFPLLQQRHDVLAPIDAVGARSSFDIFVNLRGGGPTGQAGAMRLGLARALRVADPGYENLLREGSYLTRDGRMVERKKYGQRKARRRFQFSKR